MFDVSNQLTMDWRAFDPHNWDRQRWRPFDDEIRHWEDTIEAWWIQRHVEMHFCTYLIKASDIPDSDNIFMYCMQVLLKVEAYARSYCTPILWELMRTRNVDIKLWFRPTLFSYSVMIPNVRSILFWTKCLLYWCGNFGLHINGSRCCQRDLCRIRRIFVWSC